MYEHFILNEQNETVACDLMTWARWLEANPERKRVAEDTVGGKWISTVFLGLDHRHGDGPPLLFETIVFPSEDDMSEEYCARYTTFAEAKLGHERVVACMNAGNSPEREEAAE